MRISDWSSDVCSSDLSRSRLTGCRYCAFDPRTGLDALRPIRQPTGQFGARPPGDRELLAQALSFLGPSRADRRRSSARSLPSCATRCVRSRFADRTHGRSEEHTSELQSLMRISYAVFCLKKKRQLHRTSHNTTQTENSTRV